MTRIEAFVDSIYQNVSGNKKEIQELKAEMKSHLLEAVYELKEEGKTEQEAIEIAIERFGGEKETRSVVGKLFKKQKIFAKRILNTGITLLLLSTLFLIIIIPIEKSNFNHSTEVASQILNSLGDTEEIPEQLKNDIQEIVQSRERITGIDIYDQKKFSSTDVFEPLYSFREKGLFDIWDDIGFLTYNAYSESNMVWNVSIETKSYEGTAIILFLVSIIVYWTLFIIWATINAYHHRRLNIGWILAFTLFNLFGYLIYYFSGKRKTMN